MSSFENDRDDVLKRADEAGIKYIINAGSDRAGNIKGLELSAEYPQICPAVGIHPHDAKTLDSGLFDELLSWTGNPRVVAVGEIGLDYHYMHSPKEVQAEAFRRQIALARDAGLPVIVHSREAKDDTLRILREDAAGVRGVLHCFSGDLDMAEKAMDLGFYISIAGPVTFKNALELKDTVRAIPDEFLLMETDAPYLTPVPMRGKRNEPAFITHTAQAIAEIRGVSAADIARITTVNAMRLFKIGSDAVKGEIAYRIRDSLYLNITNRCTNRCGFCVKFRTSFVKGHNLRLEEEPTAQQLIRAIKDPKEYKEIVFCGIGEPLLRLDIVKEVSAWVRDNGGKVRVNTNGHGNLIHGRNILPELKGLVDSFSISLDAEDEGKYIKVCRPEIDNAFEGVISFIKEAKNITPDVRVTVVSVPQIDIEKCRAVAQGLGVEFIVRKFDVVG